MPSYHDHGDVAGEVNCLKSMGDVRRQQKHLGEAAILYDKALFLSSRSRQILGVANCLFGLGDLAWSELNRDRARHYFKNALSSYREAGNQIGQAWCLKNLGDLANEGGQPQPVAAQALYQDALDLSERAGDPFLIGKCHQKLAGLDSPRNS